MDAYLSDNSYKTKELSYINKCNKPGTHAIIPTDNMQKAGWMSAAIQPAPAKTVQIQRPSDTQSATHNPTNHWLFKINQIEIHGKHQLRKKLRTQMWITVWIHRHSAYKPVAVDECARSCAVLRNFLRTLSMLPTWKLVISCAYFIYLVDLYLFYFYWHEPW